MRIDRARSVDRVGIFYRTDLPIITTSCRILGFLGLARRKNAADPGGRQKSFACG
jgi:hypothetical protein